MRNNMTIIINKFFNIFSKMSICRAQNCETPESWIFHTEEILKRC